MTRFEKREIIIKILYQVFLLNNDSRKLTDIIKELSDDEFVIDSVKGVIEKKKEIDKLINKYLKEGWTINRLSLVDQAILSFGTYELLYTDTPNIVCIDESIELSKKYSDDEMPKVINGVLDSIHQEEEQNGR